MVAPPASTKTSLQQRLNTRAQERWPQLAQLDVRFRGAFAYVTGTTSDGENLPLMRLRYGGSASIWGSRSTWPARTDTRTRSCPAATPPAHPKTPWTPPAASTSTGPTAWI
jgi:hypothetical protein